MKRILVLFFVFNSIYLFSQDYVSEKLKEKKHSIGVSVSPVEVVIWKRMPFNELWSNGPKLYYVNKFSPIGIAYQFKLNRLIKLNVGSYYSREYFLYNEQGLGNKNISIDYNVQYLKVPLGIQLYLSHLMHEDAIGGFFIQPGVNFDFAIKEDTERITSDFHDPRYGTPPGGWPATSWVITESHSSEWKFHRISPSIFIGHEIVFDNLSFFYGARLEMQAIYQNRNIQEYYKNRNFSLINIGANYRF